MDFTLPDTAVDLEAEIADRFGRALAKPGSTDAFHADRWDAFAHLGIWDPEASDHLHRAVGYSAVSRQGLVGPIVEAYLAVRAAGGGEPARLLESGALVSSASGSIGPDPQVVGWGAVAEATFSRSDGRILADCPLEPVSTSLKLPHGWLSAPSADEATPARLETETRLYAAAAMSGLIAGALDLTVGHANVRHQFGKPIASFQAVQMPLAEAKVLSDGARLAVLDAAQRLDDDDPLADVSAALAWLFAHRASHAMQKTGHQTFGALGFCLESGLPQLTGSMAWLRNAVPISEARRLVVSRRPAGTVTSESLVMEGFVMV